MRMTSFIKGQIFLYISTTKSIYHAQLAADGFTNDDYIRLMCKNLQNDSKDGGSCPCFLILSGPLDLQKSKFNYFKSLESNVMWTKPSYQDMRLGFEITMYFKTR